MASHDRALLDPAASILGTVRRLNPDLSGNLAHAALARFVFRNQAAQRMVGILSGGEILRAALAEFDGALIVVSHDQAFLDAIGVTREIPLQD